MSLAAACLLHLLWGTVQTQRIHELSDAISISRIKCKANISAPETNCFIDVIRTFIPFQIIREVTRNTVWRKRG
jgi:predicted membrane metal-binding protein